VRILRTILSITSLFLTKTFLKLFSIFRRFSLASQRWIRRSKIGLHIIVLDISGTGSIDLIFAGEIIDPEAAFSGTALVVLRNRLPASRR
jgi:hypothetical protein